MTSENGSMNISRNLSLRGEHLKKMLDASPLRQPIERDAKRVKQKANPLFVVLMLLIGRFMA